ncbi:hypothetical protein D3248_12915 [Leucobacter zeae]|nr:hypothetical protein [Leucobacter zeae]
MSAAGTPSGGAPAAAGDPRPTTGGVRLPGTGQVRIPRTRAASSPALVAATALLVAAMAVLAGIAAMPVYRTPRVWVLVGVAAAFSFGIVWAGKRLRWGALALVALLGACLVALVPLAVPSALGGGIGGIVDGLGDGLAAVALGWKQLLTLTLPVGTYQSVLVPLLVVTVVSCAASTALALGGGRRTVLAGLPALLPVLFGTVFGASTVSAPLQLGPLAVPAPRELAVWLAAFALVGVWIAWSAGIDRRAALRLGRAGGGAAEARAGRIARGCIGAGVVAAALVLGSACAPLLDPGSRTVPRDRIDPEIVIGERTSPLAGYRSWKRDEAFAAPLFEVSSEGRLPGRLRIAVMDRYDGVDYSVASGVDGGRFTRFPSGETLSEPARVRIGIAEGYHDIWAPLAPPLAGPPRFGGDRAGALADGFYVNRDTGAAVLVPTAAGLRAGDSYTAEMSAAADAELAEAPVSAEPLVDLKTVPQLETWLGAQELPATAEGLREAIDRLRERGYLSHSLTDGEGESAWLSAVSEQYGTRFVASPGGHSIARLEALFKQLNDQEREAGPDADERLYIAGIGDDEQFAAAAALIARAMGFEPRVVLGVRLGGADAGVPGTPACDAVCTGENVGAWIEVRGADGVWAPIDVSPQLEVPPTTIEEGEQLPEFPTVPEERDATQADPPAGTSDADSENRDDPDEDEASALWPILRAVGLGLAAVALIALLALFIPLVKRARRRRRRGAPEPEIRALGAWDELLDAHVDLNAPVGAAAGGARVARRGSGAPGRRGGREALGARDVAREDWSRTETVAALSVPDGAWIAATVDRAVYAREGIDERDAERLWSAVDSAVAGARSASGRWRRLLARYSLASFGVTRREARRRAEDRRRARRSRGIAVGERNR